MDKVCSRCHKSAPEVTFYEGSYYARYCVQCRSISDKQRYRANIEYNRKRAREYVANNRERVLLVKKELRVKKRLAVIEAYGGKCACCGESRYEFMAIDHINGGGKQHRKEVPPHQLTQWLITNNFPPGFQLLCHNCNMAKGIYGECPHVTELHAALIN